jgi:hypothetical protein
MQQGRKFGEANNTTLSNKKSLQEATEKKKLELQGVCACYSGLPVYALRCFLARAIFR